MQVRVGVHVSIAGRMDMAFDRARSIGCTTMQVFSSSPRVWSARVLSMAEIASFKTKSEEFDIKPVFMHMPYLPNFASPNRVVFNKSRAALEIAIGRANRLGVGHLILHLGSSLDRPKSVGIENASSTVSEHIDKINGMLLLENEAGQRNSIGSTLEDLAEIRDRVSSKKLGFCLDTCHAFAAGYDIREVRVLDEIEKVIGFDSIKVIHLNDAKHDLGSHLDRHDNIGSGHIGINGFRTLIGYDQLCRKPFILETPATGGSHDLNELITVKELVEKQLGK
jgi:deoxyribonuclease-4